MPPLFVVGPEGDTSELVNYRVRGAYMIVDRLFAAAELRFGGDKDQKRVRITRTDGMRSGPFSWSKAPMKHRMRRPPKRSQRTSVVSPIDPGKEKGPAKDDDAGR